jgi:hypothetical protein
VDGLLYRVSCLAHLAFLLARRSSTIARALLSAASRSMWATCRQAEKADAQILQRIPSARTIARLMTIGRDLLAKAATVTVAAIEADLPTLVEAREIIAEFHLTTGMLFSAAGQFLVG